MSKHVKVEGHAHLVRDEQTGAIINNDKESYRLYKKRKELMKTQKDEINTLKKEVSEIKFLMQTLVEKINGKDS